MRITKVLQIGHSYKPPFLHVYNQYAQCFQGPNFNLTTAYLSGAEDETIKAKTVADKVLFYNFSNKQLRGLKITVIKKLLAMCRLEQYDIIICHRYKAIYAMTIVNHFEPIPVIFSVFHAMGNLTSFMRRFFLSNFSKENMIFVGVSEWLRNDIKNSLQCPDERIICLPNSIDVDTTKAKQLSRFAARRELGLSQQDYIVGTVGRLVNTKDHCTMIHAFAQFRLRVENAKLVIIGDGKLKDYLIAEIGKMQLAESVLLTGFKSEAFQYMPAFDQFILASHEESFGLVLLEAMIAGVPIVASKIPSIEAMLLDKAQYFMPGDIAACCQAMLNAEQVLHNKARLLAQENFLRVCQHYSTEAFCHKFWQRPQLTAYKPEYITEHRSDKALPIT